MNNAKLDYRTHRTSDMNKRRNDDFTGNIEYR